MTPLLTVEDLLRGLDSFPAYGALDVFGTSVRELRDRIPVPGLVTLALNAYRLARNGRSYRLDWFPDRNVLRVRREPEQNNAATAIGAGAGALLGAAAAEAAVVGLLAGGLLGLLIGGAIGAAAVGGGAAATKVFTIRFNAATRQWTAYDGGLVPWMKDHLNVP